MSGTRLVVQRSRNPRRVALALSLAALFAATAGGGCGGSSSGGPDGGAGSGGTGMGGAGGAAGSGGSGGAGGGGAGTSGTVMYSCLGADEICTQMLVQPSDVSANRQECTNHQGGTVGTGCPTAGLVGCCQASASDPSRAESCFYNATEASAAMGLCTTTWVTTP